jgi:histidinol dehydrogenase
MADVVWLGRVRRAVAWQGKAAVKDRTKTFDEVEAVLLNSEREPAEEVQAVLDAVVKFAVFELNLTREGLERFVNEAWKFASEEEAAASTGAVRRCGECDACRIESIGCPCDGSFDDGCFLCTPQAHSRPPCPPKTA